MSKDLTEFYSDDEVESIKREARDMVDLLNDESEYQSYAAPSSAARCDPEGRH